MCRLLAYLGQPILLDKFLYEPQNSMITQSFNAKELEEPLNGDGFGIGWYAKDVSIEPAVFVSIYPAWNNRNLRYLSGKIQTDCMVAHVRAASVGEVMESNCHPFHFGRAVMAHNGGVEEFSKIKRPLRELLHDEYYLWIKGQTDSEHLFALFLQYLHAKGDDYNADDVADAFEQMIATVKGLMEKQGILEDAYLNMVYMDGERMIGLRYVTNPNTKPLTLYYSEGSKYVCEDGVCRMEPASDEGKSVMIVSEKMTDIAEDWRLIPDNHLIMVYKDLNVKLRKVSV